MAHFSFSRMIENIDGAARYDLDNKKIFGSGYFVFRNGDIIERYYGTCSADSDVPVTDTTVFRLASMTKPITTVAAMILVERGLLSLDDTVEKYLPQFKDIKIVDLEGNVSDPQKKPTVRMILTHSSGIASYQEKSQGMTADDKRTLESSIDFYVGRGLDFEPDSIQKYSGIGAFDVLEKIIVLLTGMDYLEFLTKEIFEPCGMIDTTFIPSAEQWSRMINMHGRRDGESFNFKMPDGCVFSDIPCTHYLGGAGLASTMRDYCKFAKMLLDLGQAENGRVLGEESVRLISTPLFHKVHNEFWGLGMRVIGENAHSCLPAGSFGWSGAYGSHFWIDPSNGLFAVFMKNSSVDGGAGNESARNFEKAVYSSAVDE